MPSVFRRSADGRPRNNTQVVATNAFWLILDSVFGFALALLVTIPLARVLGPEKLGYFNYVAWLATLGASLGSLGVPATAGKFMAEFRGQQKLSYMRAVFVWAVRAQVIFAGLVTAAGILLIVLWGDPSYRLVSVLQVLAIFPSMVANVATQANLANESMRANMPGSICSNVVFAVGVTLSLWLRWDLVGVSAFLLASRVLDLAVRMYGVVAWVRLLHDGKAPPELIARIRSFSNHQVVLIIMGLVIWDKSDVVLLKFLSKDIAQVTFFTMAFNLGEKAILLPRILTSSIEPTLLAQYGRDQSRVSDMAAVAGQYGLLCSMPLLFGLALIAPQLIHVLYGTRFDVAGSVLVIASLLAIVKPLLEPVGGVFQAHAKQLPVIKVGLVCAAVNILGDWILIPYMGARGAAIGNGVAQVLVVMALWTVGIRMFDIHVRWGAVTKITASGLAMAPPILLLTHLLPPVVALFLAVPAGALFYLAALRLTHALSEEDVRRVTHVQRLFPALLRPLVGRAIGLLAPRAVGQMNSAGL